MNFININKAVVEFPVFERSKSLRGALKNNPLGGIIRDKTKSQARAVRALDGITLELNEGDRLGLIGHNGSGKTTLLKLIAGIYEPVSGEVHTSGKVASLFNTAIGMDSDDTGFDNIKNIGTIMGMSKSEISEKSHEIMNFSELGDFINLPVRTYSAGMQMRLAFSIATSIEPDILLLDEGLGAGDAYFVEKAQKRVDALVARSSLLVLASHSNALIETICNKAVLMEKGVITAAGDVPSVLAEYTQRVHGP